MLLIGGDARLVGYRHLLQHRQQLADADFHAKTGFVVLASGSGRKGQFIYNPGPDERLRCGDSLIVLGETDQIDRLRRAVA